MSTLVPNEGSTARDHLANERTFLAWVRTALGLVGLGVVLGRVAAAEPRLAELDLRVTAFILVTAGGAVLAYGLWRYQRVARALELGQFPIARRGPVVVGVGALGLVGLAWFLLW